MSRTGKISFATAKARHQLRIAMGADYPLGDELLLASLKRKMVEMVSQKRYAKQLMRQSLAHG